MPVHMRYDIASHTILSEESAAQPPHGRTGLIRILQEGGSQFIGLFEKTVRLNNVPVKVGEGDAEHELRIKANRGSIIDYLEERNMLGERRFIFGAKGLFGIGLLGTGLSNQEIQDLFDPCVRGERRQNQPLSDNNLLDDIRRAEPNSIVRPVFDEEDHIPDCFQTCYSTPREGSSSSLMAGVIHVRIVNRNATADDWRLWNSQLESKLPPGYIQTGYTQRMVIHPFTPLQQ